MMQRRESGSVGAQWLGVLLAGAVALAGCSSEAPQAAGDSPAAAPPPAPDASHLEQGWMVIVSGSTDPDEAAEQFRRFQEAGPKHSGFPRMLDSSKVEGLRPGFHIVVAGIPRDKAVAEEMAEALGARWEGTYIRAVTVEGVEDVTCGDDLRCARVAASDRLQLLGLSPGDGTSMNGEQVRIEGDPSGPASAWRRVEQLTAVAGSPTLYEIYPGGGEGDCQTSMLQFEVEGAPRSRLFFDSYCFGDTSEISTTALPRDASSFVLRTAVDGIRDATINAEGLWEGTPFHEETDIVFSWRDGGLHREDR